MGSCPVSAVFSSRTVHTERTNQQPQSSSGAFLAAKEKRRGSRRVQGSIEWVLSKVPTILIMSDYEEDLDDFPAGNRDRQSESLVGTNREESTDQWTAGSGITTEIPTLFDGPASWFKYEELIDDWLDLTVLGAGNRGPALKNRLVGDAEMYKRLLDRQSLRAANGVKYFRDTLRLHFIKRAQSVFLWKCYQFTRARRGNIEMVKWIGKFTLLLKRIHVISVHHERRAKTKPVSR